jgi:hypothetical protein
LLDFGRIVEPGGKYETWTLVGVGFKPAPLQQGE